MRMLRWILGLTLRDKKRNDDIRRILGVACITDKVREARLRWFGYVQRREEDCVRRILEADVRGQRSRGRQRKRWIDVVKYNMEDLRLDLMDVENRAEWRRRTRVADPSPEGFNPAWRRERRRETVKRVACCGCSSSCGQKHSDCELNIMQTANIFWIRNWSHIAAHLVLVLLLVGIFSSKKA